MTAGDELAELHYRLHFEVDPVKRASITARIRALGGAETSQEPVCGPPRPDGNPPVASRRLGAPSPAARAVVDEDRGWRPVRTMARRGSRLPRCVPVCT